MPLLGLFLVACTPLGAWVYDDPSFHLTRVEPRNSGASGRGADSLDLVFLACNRNDYDLQLQRVSARIAIAGRVPSPLGLADKYTLPTRTMSEIMVTVSLADSMSAADQVHRRFQLDGQTTVSTPSGDRLVSWRQRGAVWTSGDSLHWVGDRGEPCRPGLSQLPSYFTPPVRLPPPVIDEPPSRARPDSSRPGNPSAKP